MNFERLNSMIVRLFFFGSFFFLATAVFEALVNRFGYTILRGTPYWPGRLLDFASVLLIFVLALLLRQIREELRKTKI